MSSRRDAVRARVVAVQRVRDHDGAVAPRRAALLEEPRDDSAAERGADEDYWTVLRRVDCRGLKFLDVIGHRIRPRLEIREGHDAAGYPGPMGCQIGRLTRHET